MRLAELQEVYFALSPEKREVLLRAERESLPTYAEQYLVEFSRTYGTQASKPLSSIFDFDYCLDCLDSDLRRTLETVISFARREGNHCYASLGTLAELLGVDKWLANRRLRRLAELGFIALTKEPVRQDADSQNPHHWRLHSYVHPVLLQGEQFYLSQLLSRYDAIETGLAFEWKGEKKSEIVDNLLSHRVVTMPTVEGEKRPAFSSVYWSSLSAQAQKNLLLQSPTDLIIKVPSGITVLDFDSHKKLNDFLSSHPEVSNDFWQTLVVETPRGFHFWFKTEQKFVSHNTELFDVRSEGSWLVVPSGNKDRDVSVLETIKALPKAVLPLLKTSIKLEQPSDSFVSFEEKIPVGSRNNLLFRFARSIRRRFSVYSQYAIEVVRRAAQCAVPLPRIELERLILNAWTLPDKSYA